MRDGRRCLERDRVARPEGLEIAVRGGGHNYPGYAVCEGGLVVDLTRMRAITVDPSAKRAGVAAARRGPTSTLRPSSMASPSRVGSSVTPVSAASRWAEALAGWLARPD
jgi:hypothetical protein